jgi:hypothetical protein
MTNADVAVAGGFEKTRHFRERQAVRHLREDVLAFVLTWGIEVRLSGATHVTVLNGKLPKEVRRTEIARAAHGWIVLLDDGQLLTCYHRADASRFVRVKPKRRLSSAQLRAQVSYARPHWHHRRERPAVMGGEPAPC